MLCLDSHDVEVLVTMLKKKFITQDTDVEGSDRELEANASAGEDHDVHYSKEEQLPSMGSSTTSLGCVETLAAP